VFDTAPSTATTVLPQLSAEDAAAVPAGSRVEIERRFATAETCATTTGVVLKASPEGIALVNCTVQGTLIHGAPLVNKLPYVSRLFKNTGVGRQAVPVLWVPLDEISAVSVVEPAPADYVAPQIEIETANTVHQGVDFDFESPDAENPI